MIIVKTYNINSDILVQKVESLRLHQEILDSGSVTGFEGVEINGLVLDILGTSLSNETTLDSTILNHGGLSYSGVYSITPSIITSDVIDWNPTGFQEADEINLQGNNKKRLIKSIIAGNDRDVKVLINVGTHDISLSHDHASSGDGNRILCPNSKTLKIQKNEVVQIEYSIAIEGWRVIATT